MTDVIFTNPFRFYFQRMTATLFIALVEVPLALRQAQTSGDIAYHVLAKRRRTRYSLRSDSNAFHKAHLFGM